MPQIQKEELKNEIEELLGELLSQLQTQWGENLVSVILFGSYARGELDMDSDIDLMIICQELPQSRFKRTELFVAVEKPFQKRMWQLYQEKGYYPYFSTILKTCAEAHHFSRLYLDMTAGDVRILYDKDKFFENVLSHFKQKLDQLGSYRKFIGKKWYWVLKPDLKPGEVFEI